MLRRVRLPTAFAQRPLRFPLPQRRWTAVTPPLESPVPTDTAAHPTAAPKKKRKTAAAAATTATATVAASAPSAVSPAAAVPKSSAADPYRPQYLQVKKQLEAEAVAAAARVSQERSRTPPSSTAGDVPARDSTWNTVVSAPATTAKETRSAKLAQAKPSSASPETSCSDDGSRGSASKDAVKGAADVPCSHDDGDPSRQGSFLSTVRHFVRSWQNGILGGIGIVTGIGVTLYVFWTPFHSDTVHQTSVVASNVLSDDKVKESAVAATKEVVEAVLRDESSVDLVVDLIDRLLKRDAARQTTGLFLKGIFEDRYTQEVTKKFVLTVVQDEWVRDQLLGVAKDLAIDLLEDESTRDVMKRFLVDTSSDALKTESLHKSTAKALRSTAVEVVKPW